MDAAPPTPGRIQDAVASIFHRGPNQQGVFESEAVSLGAARLKIIDIEGGDQPILSEDGDAVIVFNGEIYNHLELRRELEQRGYRFRSHSDTETVLNAFLEWDTDCFSRLRGMFAVALWRESERRLVLARDRMGIKPLYIARRGDDLYFGSELKAILVHPEIERWLSPDGLDCYLSLNYVPAPWTLVEGIEKLLPGQWMEWRRGAIRTESYWQLAAGQGGGLDGGGGRGGVGSAVEAVRAGTSGVRCAVGRLAERRPGFVQPGALRGGSIELASEDFFHYLSAAAVLTKRTTRARWRMHTEPITPSSI